jgi:hypothetical protein
MIRIGAHSGEGDHAVRRVVTTDPVDDDQGGAELDGAVGCGF